MKKQKEYNETLYKQRREAKQCLWCGKPLDRDGALCESCCKKGNEQSKERRRYLKSIGMCPICGKNKITYGFETCLICREKATMRARERNTPERAKYVSMYQKKTREKRKKQGICTECGKNVPEKGFSRCLECRKKRRQYQKTYVRKDQLPDRALWKSQCKCARCGKDELHPGSCMCEKCYQDSIAALEKARAVATANRAKARAEREEAEREKEKKLKEQFRPRTLWERRNTNR